jgi:hypothetical protein
MKAAAAVATKQRFWDLSRNSRITGAQGANVIFVISPNPKMAPAVPASRLPLSSVPSQRRTFGASGHKREAHCQQKGSGETRGRARKVCD